MKKLLVTGASGFLGWNICTVAKGAWDVVGISRFHDIPVDGISRERCDITDFSGVGRLFEKIRPDCVIHAAALSDPNYCEGHAAESHRINVLASEQIARLCKKYGSRCVFTSSDLVFDGEHPPYSELDDLDPVNEYGRQKAEAEALMMSAYPGMLICRMPLMFGDHPGPAKSFIQPWIDNFLAGKETALFFDELRTPVSGRDAALGILLLLESHSGVFHLGGKTSFSRYDFGVLLGKCLGMKSMPIRRASQKDVTMAAKRPRDVSLDSAKAFSRGYDPDEPETALRKLQCVKNAAARKLGFG
jgi:dTDP-4-dehydrorhamnose reductase